MKRTMIVGVAMLIVVLLAACAGGGGLYGGGSTATPTATAGSAAAAATTAPSGGTITKVTIQNFAFNPPSVTIKAGDTVEWTNQDSTTHTVTGQGFDSGDLQPGKTFSHQFTGTGTVSYGCSIHPSMKGTVVVQ